MNFKELFKNKGLGYWLCTGASVISLIFAIVVFATWKTALPAAVGDGYIIGVILLLPVIIQAVVTFFPVRFAGLAGVVLYGAALGAVINRIAQAVADHFNNVAYQGGNFGMCIFYTVAVLVLVAACITGCFFEQNKDGKYLI